MTPASKLQAARLAAPLNPKKSKPATQHFDELIQRYEQLIQQPPWTHARQPESGALIVDIEEPWVPPPPSPLAKSLGRPRRRTSAIVKRIAPAPECCEVQGMTPGPRLSVEDAQGKMRRSMKRKEERAARRAEEEAVAAAAAVPPTSPAPVPESPTPAPCSPTTAGSGAAATPGAPEPSAKELKAAFTRGAWTTVRASWSTWVNVEADMTDIKTTPLVRQALWQALVKDLLAVSEVPPAVVYGDLGMLYSMLDAFRATRVRILRNRHARFKEDMLAEVEAIMVEDLAEAAQRAQKKAPRLARAAATPAASPAASAASAVASSATSPTAPAVVSPAAPRALPHGASPVSPPAAPSAAQPSRPPAPEPIAPFIVRKPFKPVNELKRTRGDGDDTLNDYTEF